MAFSLTDVDVTGKNAVSGVSASHGAVTFRLQVNEKVSIVVKETVRRLTCSAFKVNSASFTPVPSSAADLAASQVL